MYVCEPEVYTFFFISLTCSAMHVIDILSSWLE
jgi:hypothetical protein